MKRALLALLAFAASTGCRVERPYPPPTAEELIDYVKSVERRVETMRAEARVTYATSSGPVRVKVWLLVGPGDRLRLDLVSPVDTPLQTVVACEGRFALLDAAENRFLRGPTSSCALSRVLPVGLGAMDVGRVLRGTAPLLAPAKARVSWDSSEGVEVLTLHAPDGARQEVRFRGERNRWQIVRSETRDARGALTLLIEPEHAGSRLDSIRLRSDTRRSGLEIRFRYSESNVKLDEAVFQLDVPPGVSIEELVCTDAVLK